MIRRQNRMKTSPGAAAMEILRSQGRNGDTELAHVNPREKALLKALGGAGTRNPRTGMREFYEAGVDVGGGDQGPGQQGDLGMGSGPSFSPEGTSNAGVDTGVQFGPTSVPGLVEQGIAKIGEVLTDPGNIPGFGLAGMALGQGMTAANRAAREAGYSVVDPVTALGENERGYANAVGLSVGAPGFEAFGAGMPGANARGDSLAASMGVVPVSAPLPKYLRGGETTPPQEIGSFIGPGMSDLQQRALISTYGTQGVNSAFRTDPVRRYYANLLSRGLISDAGSPVANPYILPIEQQYASSVLGRPIANPADAAAAYESIRGFL